MTPTVAKHRAFVWCTAPTVPDHQLIAFGTTSDYFFGILHSRPHELWSLAQGTQVRERESRFRYTPTTCFETFPFPKPTDEQRLAIAAAVKRFGELRTTWLNPPELVKTVMVEFTGSVDGPWWQYITNPDKKRGTGTVRYPQVVPQNSTAGKLLAKRTLTNLYNARLTRLDIAHRDLDAAVFAAFGWDASMTGDATVEALLALNLERTPAGAAKAAEDTSAATDQDEDQEDGTEG